MLIAIVVAVPVVLFTLLRINAAIVFLSLCLGSVLVNLASGDALSVTGIVSPRLASNSYIVPLILLLLPAALTAIFMMRTVKKGLPLLINVLPAAGVGIVGLLLAVPLCAPGLRHSLTSTSIWHELELLQTMAVIVSAAVSLFFLWLQRPGRPGHEEKKK